MGNKNQVQSVQTVELFYDLVFVYLISRIAHVFESIEVAHLISIENIGKFGIMFFVVWMIWTYQVVYINRFFRGKLYEYGVLFFNMYVILVLSQNFTISFQDTFIVFASCTTILLSSIGLQYGVHYFVANDPDCKEFSKALFIPIALSSLTALISLMMESPLNMLVYLFSILIAILLPLNFRKSIGKVPVKFHHLAERYELLVILFFGEALVGIAKVMGDGAFHLVTIVSFLIIMTLFWLYTMNFSKVQKYHKKTDGLVIIFTHLFIIMAIMFITILLEKLAHVEAFNTSYTLSIFICIVVFIGMIQINLQRYTTPEMTRKSFYYIGLSFIISFILLLNVTNILLAKVVILTLLILLSFIYKKKTNLL